MLVGLPVAALMLQIGQKQIVSASFFLLMCLPFYGDTSLSVSQAVLPSLPLLRSPSLSLSAHSLSPPIPSLSTPLTLPVPSSYPASQVTMTGGFLAPILWSFSARLRAIAHACVRVRVCVRASASLPVCLPSMLSRVLVPASWQRGATQQPICDWAGERGS